MVRRLPLLALLLVIASAASAQHTLPRMQESIEVSLANVDVVVTDKKGNRVRGLTVADFELLDDRKPQVITNFAEYTPEAANVAEGTVGVDEAAARTAPATPRTIVIFAENFVLAPFHTKPLFARLRETVRRMVRPGDAAAVVTWSDALIVRQDFTDDVAALETALNAIERENTGVPGNPAQLMSTRENLAKMFEGSIAVESFKQMNDRAKPHWDALDQALFQLFKIRQKTFALTSLMQRMTAYEGKKIVLMATHRFGEHAGAEYFGGVVPGQYRAMLDTRQHRRTLITTANAYGITVYPLYPEGLETTIWSAADMNPGAGIPNKDAEMLTVAFNPNVLNNELRSLEEIARETGGVMEWSSKEVASVLPQIADDLETYYSLGWRVHGPRAGSQKIVVRTKNRDYVVRARREYAFRSDDARMQDRVVANLFEPVNGGVIPIEATLGELRQTSKRRWMATLHVRIPIDALAVTEGEKGLAGEFSVYVAPGAVFGLVTDVQRRAQKFTLQASQLARARGSHFTYEVELKIDHLVDRVAVGVFDETSKEFGLITVPVPERKKNDGV
jgi:VWFA-related protein